MTETAKPKRQRRFARMPQVVTTPEKQMEATGPDTEQGSAPPEPGSLKAASKISQVITLLQRCEGATLDEMITATNWLPHTTRAALTGLRKKGHSIDKTKRDDATCYRIVAAA